MITPENNHHHQTFHRFFDGWIAELNIHLEQLNSAANHHHGVENIDNIDDDSVLRQLIEKAVRHYDHYYKAKSDEAKGDVILMFTPTWLTSLEDAFLWVAGWRPTTAIHLLYSKSGIQLEARLTDLIPVFTAGDLGDLNLNQINRVDELQKKTIREEKIINEKMATLQESAADTPMVDLSNEISETMRKDNDDGGRESDRRVESALEPKTDALEKVSHMADGLRMETLKSVVAIPTRFRRCTF